MSVTVKLNLDIPAAIAKRGLENGGPAQRFLTHEVRRVSDPYVPMDTGMLKNTAQENENQIIYPGPYARRQWHEHKGSGLRGPRWVKRAMIDHGHEVTDAVARYVGGRPK